MRRILGIVAFLALTYTSVSHAIADTRSLSGTWRQIASNAGQCYDCRLDIEREGSLLRVTSSNGWFAIVEVNSRGNATQASGVGRWQPRKGGSYSLKAFVIRVTLIGDQLYMNMTVPEAGGMSKVIQAIFEKHQPKDADNPPRPKV